MSCKEGPSARVCPITPNVPLTSCGRCHPLCKCWVPLTFDNSEIRFRHAKSCEWKYAFPGLSPTFHCPGLSLSGYSLLMTYRNIRSLGGIRSDNALLTMLDDWTNSYICRWVGVHLLLLCVFLDSALLSNLYFFLT